MENQENKIYNNSSAEEAAEIIKKENVKLLDDSIAFYIEYVEEVDEKPDQLIGIESEDTLIEEMNRRYIPVVAVSESVKDVKIGDKIFMEDRTFGQTSYFTAKGLKFGLIPRRVINVIKEG